MIPEWLDGPANFDTPDPSTPLFESLWSVLGMRGSYSPDEADADEEDPTRFAGGDGSVYRLMTAEEFEADDGN